MGPGGSVGKRGLWVGVVSSCGVGSWSAKIAPLRLESWDYHSPGAVMQMYTGVHDIRLIVR